MEDKSKKLDDKDLANVTGGAVTCYDYKTEDSCNNASGNCMWSSKNNACMEYNPG